LSGLEFDEDVGFSLLALLLEFEAMRASLDGFLEFVSAVFFDPDERMSSKKSNLSEVLVDDLLLSVDASTSDFGAEFATDCCFFEGDAVRAELDEEDELERDSSPNLAARASIAVEPMMGMFFSNVAVAFSSLNT